MGARVPRRALLRGALGSALGLALLPAALASAQAAAPAVTPVEGGPLWAVTVSEASLRAQPELADNRFAFARTGTPLQILGYTGDWAYVYNPHTHGTAYIASHLLAPGEAPSRCVAWPAPPLLESFEDTAVVTRDTVLAAYPWDADEAVFQPLNASSQERVIGTVRDDKGALWYQTSDYYYFPVDGVFLAGQADTFAGRWLQATLLPTTHVEAYEGQDQVRTMRALRGVAAYPTPLGTFSIQRRVANEIMDSLTVGIPRNSPYGYYVTNVLWTQYFTPDGASFHDNYWSSNFGGAGSHGCLGLSLGDSKWLWDWASIGTPVVVNPA